MFQKRSPALQQYLSQQESSKQYQSQQDQPSTDVSYESVLSLFNSQEIIRPTTFRPPTHRFAAPQARSLFGGQKQGVQVQSSVSLTPEPIVFTQIGNQPLQRVYNPQTISGQEYTQQDGQQANTYVQNQQLQQTFLVPQPYALQDQQKLQRPSQVQSVPGFLLQPSLNFVQQPVNLPQQIQQESKAIQPGQFLQIQQEPRSIQPPSQFLQIPNAAVPQFTYNTISEGLTPPLFYQRPPLVAEASATFLQQQPPVQCLPPACNVPREARQYLPRSNPPLQDLPNPYHELASRRSYLQQHQQLQQDQRRQYTF